MLADISLFESNIAGGGSNTTFGLSIFNSSLASTFEEYATVKRDSVLCEKFIAQSGDTTPSFKSKLYDLQAETDKTLRKLEQDISKTSENEKLDEADKRVLAKYSPNMLDEIANRLQPRDATLVRYVAKKKRGELSKSVFNDDPKWVQGEFAKLRGEVIESVTAEVRQRANDLTDSNVNVFTNIAKTAIEQLVGELSELTPETGSAERLGVIMQRFSDAVTAADATTQRVPLTMPRSSAAVEKLRHLLEGVVD